jgi:hypothetical protein
MRELRMRIAERLIRTALLIMPPEHDDAPAWAAGICYACDRIKDRLEAKACLSPTSLRPNRVGGTSR